MAQLVINTGTNANDGTGDSLRDAMIKTNTNFTELYTSPLGASAVTIAGNKINANQSNADLELQPSGTGSILMTGIKINDNNIEGVRSNEDINLVPAGTGSVTFGAISFQGNEIVGTRSNENIVLSPAGTGGVVLGSLKFAGTTISSDDSSSININEGLIVDGTLNVSGTSTLTGAVTASSTLGVTGAATLSSTLAVTGVTTLTTTNIDNLNFYDNYITSDSNADINIQAGGTGDVVLDAIRVNGTTLDSSDSSSININEGLIVDGTANVSGATTITGAATLESTLGVTGLATLSSLTVTGATTFGGGGVTIDNITINDNTISSSSNADINITPGGTGSIVISSLTIDSNISITDNEIKATASNSNLEIAGSGTGQVVIAKADINSGAVDNTVIGGATPLAGTFTTLTANTSAVIDGVTITANVISSNSSNANLYLTGNGTGSVRVSGFTFPTSDGSNGQFIKTDGAGALSFATAGATLSYSDIADATTTIASSSQSVLNTFAHASYRSAKYYISWTDTENSKYELVEANVTHDGTNAYIATFGSVTNYAPDGSSTTTLSPTFAADINGSNVRILVTNPTADSMVFRFQRVTIDA